MTTISSPNPAVETIAGLAAVVGEAEGTNNRLPRQDASAFGALMGFFGQQAAGGQLATPPQDNDNIGEPVRVDLPVDAAADLTQAPLDDVLMQAMWPMVQNQLSHTPNVSQKAEVAPQQSAAEVPEQAVSTQGPIEARTAGTAEQYRDVPEAHIQVPQAAQTEATKAVVARVPQQAALVAGVPSHQQQAPVQRAATTSVLDDTSKPETTDEPTAQYAPESEMLAWQRAAYAQSMATPARDQPVQVNTAVANGSALAQDAAQPVEDDGVQPAPPATGALSADAATNPSRVRVLSATQSAHAATHMKFAEQMSSTISRALGDALGENEDALLDDATSEGPTAPDGTMGSFFPAGMMPAVSPMQQHPQGAAKLPVDDNATNAVAYSRGERRAPERAAQGVNRQDEPQDEADLADIEAQPEAFQQVLHGAQNPVAHSATAQSVNQAAAIAQAPPVQSIAVSQELSQAITQGARNVQMRIVPEGLGELNIKVQMTGQNVHLTIRGDAPELAQLLGQKVQELRQDLHNQGLSLEAMDFGTLSSSQQETAFGHDNGARGFYDNNSDASAGSHGLQRIAGSKETSQVRPTGRVQRAGPKDRIIDVVL